LIAAYSPGASEGGYYAQATAALADVFEVGGWVMAGTASAGPLAALIDHFDPDESMFDREPDRKNPSWEARVAVDDGVRGQLRAGQDHVVAGSGATELGRQPPADEAHLSGLARKSTADKYGKFGRDDLTGHADRYLI